MLFWMDPKQHFFLSLKKYNLLKMRKIITLLFLLPVISCAEMQQIADQLPQSSGIGTLDISNGLKEALNNGISKQVIKLTATDGFFRNEMVKILLPQELQKVDK